jgi:DNA-directed RNA polymerase specialized sigma24 family protein
LNNQITLSRFRLQNDTISEVTKRERDDMQQKQQDEDELDQNADSLSLYDRYGLAIFAYARLHVPSREDAEDVTLEVFTAALENDNFSGLQEGEKLAWLRRVAHNKLVDIYRRSTNHPELRSTRSWRRYSMTKPVLLSRLCYSVRCVNTCIGLLKRCQCCNSRY